MNFLSQVAGMFLGFLRSLVRIPRSVHVTLPMAAAVLAPLFLILCVVVVVLVNLDSDQSYLGQWWSKLPVVLLIIVVSPFVAYYGVRLFLLEGVSAFEDIDRAWKAGLEELVRKGINIQEMPIFLIFGSTAERGTKALFEATRIEFQLRGVPTGSEPLQWYARYTGGQDDAIYISLNRVGRLSRLLTKQTQIDEEYASHRFRGDVAPDSLLPSTVQPPGNLNMTLSPEQAGLLQTPPPSAAFLKSPANRGEMDLRGTLAAPTNFGGPSSLVQTISIGQMRDQSLGPKPKAVLERTEAEEESQRLEHVCKLLRRARLPLAPINGSLFLLPCPILVGNADTVNELRKALAGDVDTAVSHLKLRFPATTVVVNMESESGFHELINRLGREKVKNQRFGKSYDVWARPTKENIELLNGLACGNFETFVYNFYRERGALEKPRNRELYALLCKARYYMQKRLGGILVDAFSEDSQRTPNAVPLFSGCYFAATGERMDDQALIRGVFDRLPEQQEELEWTSSALREDGIHRMLATVGGLICILLFGYLCLTLYQRFSAS